VNDQFIIVVNTQKVISFEMDTVWNYVEGHFLLVQVAIGSPLEKLDCNRLRDELYFRLSLIFVFETNCEENDPTRRLAVIKHSHFQKGGVGFLVCTWTAVIPHKTE
jgi:hypothetical protein